MTANIDDARTKTLVSHHGARISYSVIGDGPKTLMLANGLGGRLYAWEPVVAALGDRYRIITWDYRGLFDSTPPEKISRMGVTDHAEDAIAILDAEGVDRAVFCGWSMGVQVSLDAAAHHPERVAGLVLLNGTYGHVFSSGFQPWVRVPWAGALLHGLVEYVMDHPPLGRGIATAAPYFVTPLTGFFWLVSGTPIDRMRRMMGRYTREVFDDGTFPHFLRLFQELDAHSVRHHLRQIRAPALIVSGAWDSLTPAYQSRVMAKRLPDAEAIHLRRASHFVLLERPEVVVPAMERFLTARATW